MLHPPGKYLNLGGITYVETDSVGSAYHLRGRSNRLLQACLIYVGDQRMFARAGSGYGHSLPNTGRCTGVNTFQDGSRSFSSNKRSDYGRDKMKWEWGVELIFDSLASARIRTGGPAVADPFSTDCADKISTLKSYVNTLFT